jgi:hypothetical protein
MTDNWLDVFSLTEEVMVGQIAEDTRIYNEYRSEKM